MEKFIDFAFLSKNCVDQRRKWFIFHYAESGLVYIGIYRFRIAFNWKNNLAVILYYLNVIPKWSSDIAGDITCGYGCLDKNGFWQFQLSSRIVNKIRKKAKRSKDSIDAAKQLTNELKKGRP